MLVTTPVAIDFHSIFFFFKLWKSMATVNCLITDIVATPKRVTTNKEKTSAFALKKHLHLFNRQT